MTPRTTLISLAASLGLVFAVLPAQAATPRLAEHHVSEAQLDSLHAGESTSEITQALGKPENTTKWIDGSRSLVYELTSPGDTSKLAYVDLNKDGSMADVQIIER